MADDASGLEHRSVDLLRGHLSAQCEVVLSLEPRLVQALSEQDGDQSIELVHDIRVAIRRLRSTLRTFATAFETDEAERFAGELRWYAEALGTMRDLDIVEARTAAQLAGLDPDLILGDVSGLVAGRLAADRAERRRAWHDVLASQRHTALLRLLTRWRRKPCWSSTSGRISESALHRAVRRTRKQRNLRLERAFELAEAGRASNADVLALLHQARKSAKRYRYAAELTSELSAGSGAEAEPVDSGQLISQHKELQDQLGVIQDSTVTAAWLRQWADQQDVGRTLFTVGVLVAAERAFQGTALAAVIASWD